MRVASAARSRTTIFRIGKFSTTKKNKNWSLKLMFEQIELNEESMVYHTCCGVTSQVEIKLDSLSVTAKAEFKLVYFITFTVR